MKKSADPTPEGVDAARAWLRLNDALDAFDRYLRRVHGVTGGQLAIMRIIAEGDTTLTRLRARLAMHPATLGQIIDRIAKRGLVDVSVSQADRRSRTLTLTAAGRRLLAEAPLAGPVRLRMHGDPVQARRLASAFGEAVEAFGLERWAS